MEKGIEQGIKQGIEQGIEQGKMLAMKEIANKLILTFKDEKKVASLLGIDETTLRELLK
jgi:flagellar biosynthesis/type III secretory pathway protein FliH